MKSAIKNCECILRGGFVSLGGFHFHAMFRSKANCEPFVLEAEALLAICCVMAIG